MIEEEMTEQGIDIIIDDGGISRSRRIKTMSKHYYDDEIKFINPTNGDIHLKDGVHRLSYNTHIRPDVLETHINDIDLKAQKTKSRIKEVYTKEDGITEY